MTSSELEFCHNVLDNKAGSSLGAVETLNTL